MASDIYMEKLKEIIGELERIYGLQQESSSGMLYIREDIGEVMKYVTTNVSRIQDRQRVEKNTEAGRQVVLLSYLNSRLRYYSKRKLDFKEYPRLDEIARILLLLIKKSSTNENSIRELNKIILIMENVDSEFIQYKMGLAYRFLRICLIMILFGNYCNAGIVADFIINQIMLGAGYDS